MGFRYCKDCRFVGATRSVHRDHIRCEHEAAKATEIHPVTGEPVVTSQAAVVMRRSGEPCGNHGPALRALPSRVKMPKREYEDADEVRAIAERIVIPRWHEPCGELRIVYLATDDLGTHNGRKTIAQIRRATPVETHLAGIDIVFVVDALEWAEMDEPRRIALVDHEFCHVEVDGDGVKMRGHDVEEFNAVVQRHGAWSEDLARFVRAIGGEP